VDLDAEGHLAVTTGRRCDSVSEANRLPGARWSSPECYRRLRTERTATDRVPGGGLRCEPPTGHRSNFELRDLSGWRGRGDRRGHRRGWHWCRVGHRVYRVPRLSDTVSPSTHLISATRSSKWRSWVDCPPLSVTPVCRACGSSQRVPRFRVLSRIPSVTRLSYSNPEATCGRQGPERFGFVRAMWTGRRTVAHAAVEPRRCMVVMLDVACWRRQRHATPPLTVSSQE
jgi:hypothetical protein